MWWDYGMETWMEWTFEGGLNGWKQEPTGNQIRYQTGMYDST